jgi:hypothetical protein
VRSAFGPARATLRTSDALRRWQGRVLDLVGLGPRPAPSTVLLSTPLFRLRRYKPRASPAMPVLIVAAPIKRAYIWDMAPEVSPVRLLSDAGFATHLLEWLDPQPSHADAGLDTYVEQSVAAAVDVVRRAGDGAAVLVGHSLGGTLAALYGARHPRQVAGMVLLEAPLNFGPAAGAFAPVVATSPNARWLQTGFDLVPGRSSTWSRRLRRRESSCWSATWTSGRAGDAGTCGCTCRCSAGRWTSSRYRAGWSPRSSRTSTAVTGSCGGTSSSEVPGSGLER